MADVEALDALRRVLELEQVAQRLEAREQRLPAREPLRERGFRVAAREIEKPRAIAAHVRLDLDAVAAALGQRLGERHAILGRVAHDQLGRHRPFEIVLRDERTEDHGFVRIGRQSREKIARAEADPVAEEKHGHARDAVADLARDHVHVGVRALHIVMRLHTLDGRDLVADQRRALERELARRALHRADELLHDRIGAPVEEHRRVAHVVAVCIALDQADARRRAAPDLMLQARPRAVLEIAVLAVADLEELLDQVEALAHRTRARKRPEITPAAAARAAMECETRILARRQVYVRIALVVAENDVVARLQRLDQLRFEQQRLGLGARDHRLDARDLRDHRGNARIHVDLEEVAPDALPEAAGLADVEQLVVRAEHAVDAGRIAQRADECLAVELGL